MLYLEERISAEFRNTIDGIPVPESAGTSSPRKYVAQWLISEGYWPAMQPQSAEARMNACLDPHKEQYLRVSELVAIVLHFRQLGLVKLIAEATHHKLVKEDGFESEEELIEKITDLDREIDARRNARNELAAKLSPLQITPFMVAQVPTKQPPRARFSK